MYILWFAIVIKFGRMTHVGMPIFSALMSPTHNSSAQASITCEIFSFIFPRLTVLLNEECHKRILQIFHSDFLFARN